MTDKHQIKETFSKLLDEEVAEQKYQEFLEQHPYFIPREFVQNHGIHFSLVFRKLSLAKDYITDFFYMSKSSDDWNCVLVEIEKPQSRFFKSGSNDFHGDFAHSLSQIRRWRTWFEESANKEHFVSNTLRSIRRPLERNPCFIKYVLVHGRREEYQDNHIRSGLIRAEERDDFKIITYDSLMESLNSKSDLYIAVKANEYVDIISDRFIDESLFSWVSPTALRITKEMKEDALRNRSSWHHYIIRNRKKVLAVEHALAEISVKG